MPSSAPLLVSGTADPAGRPPPEEPTLSRKRTDLVALRTATILGAMLGVYKDIANIYHTELPLPPPQGQRSVVCERLLRSKGTLGNGSVELFERLSLHRQLPSG
jgi:hypothetical protein